jgi:CelD/BcsL family acetyltransferase involved in cellulose biosynthesis
MRVKIVSIQDIPADLIVQWNNWASPQGKLISPYFRFEFAETISLARPDVQVAIIEEGGDVIGFFPHHTPRSGVVRPVGAPMSDYQGIIAAPDQNIDPLAVIRATGASATVFDNWYSPLGSDRVGRRNRSGSVIVDLADGAEAYFDRQRSSFKNHFKKIARRHRAAERELGPVRVELGDAEGKSFDTLLKWKQKQYRDTGKLNVFGIEWVRTALNNFRRREGQEFSGLTASLWFGDRLAAVEFGLAAEDVYHSWFPAYDPEFAKYSPGLLLLHGLFEKAATRSRTRIDLGRGGAEYKKYYASYEVPLDSGWMLTPGLASLGIRSWQAAESVAQYIPGSVSRLPGRLRRRWSQATAFEPRLAPRIATLASSLSF